MTARRRPPSTRHTRRVARDMRDATIGTHVTRSSRSSRPSGHVRRGSASSSSQARSPRGSRQASEAFSPSASRLEERSSHHRGHQRQYTEAVQRRARTRKIAFGAIIALVVIGIALLAGIFAFRTTVGSEMSLRNSNASEALVAVRSDEPYYTLVAVELGAVAEPLEQEGPDILLLVFADRANKQFGIVNIPASLQVAVDGGTHRVADLAANGDAQLIQAVANYAKVDISHYVKVGKDGLPGIVDALGGIEVNIDQVIDDPHAGDMYIPVGTYTLNGSSALTYLRTTNLKLGITDQLDNQVSFAGLLFEKLFSAEGNFSTRIETMDSYFQTDMSLGDIESLQSWVRDIPAASMTRVALPGYMTEVTGVVDTGDPLFVGSADKMAEIVGAFESGTPVDTRKSSDVDAAATGSFTLEVQNGTMISGAAGVTGDLLKAQGFNVTEVGNAEQPIYDETLVVYKNAEGQGLSRARAVIDALGMGRAVEGDTYYSFETDVLLIIGADYKPTS